MTHFRAPFAPALNGTSSNQPTKVGPVAMAKGSVGVRKGGPETGLGGAEVESVT